MKKQQIKPRTKSELQDPEHTTIEEIDDILRGMSNYHSICTKMNLIDFWLDIRLDLMEKADVVVHVTTTT